MTREEEIKRQAEKKALEPSRLMHPYANQYKVMSAYEIGFIEGAVWADKHPRWISVEEQDIPLGQWVITYAPNEDIYCNIDVKLLMMDETAEDFGITHWMPLPQPPKEGGER